MMRAELDGIICSGARRGKQFTYALLDERAPRPKILERDEALAELAKRYFTSHGPATLQDFVWWSGLAAADARAALEMIKSLLMHEVVGDQTYWFAASIENSKDVPLAAHLLPNFDEYIVGYADRSASFDAVHTNRLGARDSILSHYTIAIHGQIVGTWKRTFRKGAVVIASNPFTTLTAAESEAVNAAAHRYGEFLGMPVVLT